MVSTIIVVGASAGGKDALCKLAATLPQDLNAAVFIVLHLARQGIDNFLTNRLQKCTSLTCVLAADGLAVQKSHMYIAPVDSHLILKKGNMYLSKGPAENRWRPSIDVLFRSAAVYYNKKTIGIILTGLLDDGTAGMQAIKRCGGTCIVQDPREAAYPDMPQSVINNTMVDFILPVTDMNEAIQEIIFQKPREAITIPEDIKGHAWSENDLAIKQFESLNSTLWVALRMMEERRNLLTKISGQEQEKNRHSLAQMHTEQAEELDVHIAKLKDLLFNVKAG